MKKLLWIVPCLMLSVTGCSSHHKRDPEKKMAKMEKKISSELDLNDDQEMKLKAVFDAKKAIMEENKAQKEMMLGEMQAMIKEPTLDRTKFKSLMDKKETLHEAKEDAFMERVYPKLATFHDSLTAEQREKAAKCMKKHTHHGMMY